MKADLNILKNIKDLEYSKMLKDYNAYLIGVPTLSVAIVGLAWQLSSNIILSVILGLFSFVILWDKKEEVEDALNSKLTEIKNL